MTPVSRSNCLAEMPVRVEAMRNIAWNQVLSDVLDLWKMVSAVGETWAPQNSQE